MKFKILVVMAVVGIGCVLLQNEIQKLEETSVQRKVSVAVTEIMNEYQVKVDVRLVDSETEFMGGCTNPKGTVWMNRNKVLEMSESEVKLLVAHTGIHCQKSKI